MDDPVRSQNDLEEDRKRCGSDKESASSGLGLRASSLRQTAYINVEKSTEYVGINHLRMEIRWTAKSKHGLFWSL